MCSLAGRALGSQSESPGWAKLHRSLSGQVLQLQNIVSRAVPQPGVNCHSAHAAASADSGCGGSPAARSALLLMSCLTIVPVSGLTGCAHCLQRSCGGAKYCLCNGERARMVAHDQACHLDGQRWLCCWQWHWLCCRPAHACMAAASVIDPASPFMLAKPRTSMPKYLELHERTLRDHLSPITAVCPSYAT